MISRGVTGFRLSAATRTSGELVELTCAGNMNENASRKAMAVRVVFVCRFILTLLSFQPVKPPGCAFRLVTLLGVVQGSSRAIGGQSFRASHLRRDRGICRLWKGQGPDRS